MFPQMASAILSWGSTVEMKIVSTAVVDFEPSVEVLNIVSVDMVLQVMKARDVDRKPENLRRWKFWDGWSASHLPVDTVLQDPDGRQYRVQASEDWGQSGFWKYSLIEQPVDLP